MEEQQFIPRVEVLRYISAWKSELDLRQKELNSRLFGGAMGGVVTIVLSAGLALDKVSQGGWVVRVALGLCLFLLLVGAGNIMNCFRVAINGQLLLLAQERELALTQSESIAQSALQELGEQLTTAVEQAQIFYRYSYGSIALAVIVGAVTFFVTLFRA